MLIHANVPVNGQFPIDWAVYHSHDVKFMKNVVWVDDESNQYAIGRIIDNEVCESIYQADKVLIMTPIKLIVINPVIDNNMFMDTFRIMSLMKSKQ